MQAKEDAIKNKKQYDTVVADAAAAKACHDKLIVDSAVMKEQFDSLAADNALANGALAKVLLGEFCDISSIAMFYKADCHNQVACLHFQCTLHMCTLNC